MKNNTRLIKLFFDLTRHLKEMYKRLNTSDSVSMLQQQVLRFINSEKEPTMKEVAAYFSITPASATSLVNSLVQLSYIKRLPDLVDRRIVKLALTKQGEEIMLVTKKRTEKHLGVFLEKLSIEEQDTLAVIFEKLLSE